MRTLFSSAAAALAGLAVTVSLAAYLFASIALDPHRPAQLLGAVTHATGHLPFGQGLLPDVPVPAGLTASERRSARELRHDPALRQAIGTWATAGGHERRRAAGEVTRRLRALGHPGLARRFHQMSGRDAAPTGALAPLQGWRGVAAAKVAAVRSAVLRVARDAALAAGALMALALLVAQQRRRTLRRLSSAVLFPAVGALVSLVVLPWVWTRAGFPTFGAARALAIPPAVLGVLVKLAVGALVARAVASVPSPLGGSSGRAHRSAATADVRGRGAGALPVDVAGVVPPSGAPWGSVDPASPPSAAGWMRRRSA